MKVTEINKQTLQNIRPLVDAALNQLGETLGIKFHAGNCSFSIKDFTFKLNGRLPDSDGEFIPKTHQDFKNNAHFNYGLEPEDLGAEFEVDGTTYVIDGCKPRSTKYGILGKRADGKVFKFKPRTVRVALGRPEYGNF